jgi:two-component system alkaline phosphatase synthesis response regulator PhoP
VQYSLILLDVMMGEMSGFKMAQILKVQTGDLQKFPLSSSARPRTQRMTKVAGLDMGADDYISKAIYNQDIACARQKRFEEDVSARIDIHNDLLRL